jgi:hypothetical protein
MADYWLKLYIEILDDPKMATLPDRLWRRIVELFLMAKRENKDGHLPDTRQIAWALRMPADELDHDLKSIVSTGIITQEAGGWFIPKFAARQAAVPARDRMAEMRLRNQKRQYDGDVTPQLRSVTQSTEQITEQKQSRAEAPADPADLIQETLISNGVVPNGEDDFKAISELAKSGVIPQDIVAGIEWKSKNNGSKIIRYVSQVVGPAKTAMAKRLQSGATSKKQEPAYTGAVVLPDYGFGTL